MSFTEKLAKKRNIYYQKSNNSYYVMVKRGIGYVPGGSEQKSTELIMEIIEKIFQLKIGIATGLS